MRHILIPPASRPTILFDKSFLETLKDDESAWFHSLFRPNVCPVFYVETLMDLSKRFKDGRKPTRAVQIIARKCLESAGFNIHHEILVVSELMGHDVVPMDGQIPIPYIRKSETGVPILEVQPERQAFQRWQEGDFSELEQEYARVWRSDLENFNLRDVAEEPRKTGMHGKTFEHMKEAKTASTQFLAVCHPCDALRMAMKLAYVPISYHDEIFARWEKFGSQPLPQFAPYTGYFLEVNMFFVTSLADHFISAERNAHYMDMQYLYYLPFCNIFVSDDKEQTKWAKLFLRDDQLFIRGKKLKEDLSKLNILYRGQERDKIRNEKVISFVEGPPKDNSFLVTRLWDRYSPGWREALPSELREDIESGLLKSLPNAKTPV
jgi:hypothetical protein